MGITTNLQVSKIARTKNGNLLGTAKPFMKANARMFQKHFTSMRRNVNRRKCPKSKRSTSESLLKLKEKLPTGSAPEHQTMNTPQQKSGKLISQAIDCNQANTYLMFNIHFLIFAENKWVPKINLKTKKKKKKKKAPKKTPKPKKKKKKKKK